MADRNQASPQSERVLSPGGSSTSRPQTPTSPGRQSSTQSTGGGGGGHFAGQRRFSTIPAEKIHVVPVMSLVQKISIYETKRMFYVIGSNGAETAFRLLKIDRSDMADLNVVDDRYEYSQTEMSEIIERIKSRMVRERGSKLSLSSAELKPISAFGLIGFVRFTQGYYMVLITRRKKHVLIGQHYIYKIDNTTMIYIPNEKAGSNSNSGSGSSEGAFPAGWATGPQAAKDEAKYVKIFQNVGLSSNFYFSYSYDLTHALQFNMTTPSNAPIPQFPQLDSMTNEIILPWQKNPFKENVPNWKLSDNPNGRKLRENLSNRITEDMQVFGLRSEPNWKFVWNEYLFQETDLHPDWKLWLIHGFIVQANICVLGQSLYLTLIARRSAKFAGTRFLKRGANWMGDVANEVETEQIVSDAAVASLHESRVTSFVQMRGSVPVLWSQDVSKGMVPKPSITIDLEDPFHTVAGRHFNDLLLRYGSPVICLNLVKKREKKPQESILSSAFQEGIRYLNQFIPPECGIIHKGFDMARVNKLHDANVMSGLEKIGYDSIKLTGIFQSWPREPELDDFTPSIKRKPNAFKGTPFGFNKRNYEITGGYRTPSGRLLQTGIVRTNCVDCLDRTNTAQFAIGKVALGYQLYALGVLDMPTLEFDTDTVRLLEELYEDHGDVLALQYGGSQLVHRIKTYRKIAPFSSTSRDIMQTLSRYYSNAFSDWDKQMALNLFLGIFRPFMPVVGVERPIFRPKIWELATDFYLHNPITAHEAVNSMSGTPLVVSQWCDDTVIYCLPRSAREVFKGTLVSTLVATTIVPSRDRSINERIDGFQEMYTPNLWIPIAGTLQFNMLHTSKQIMPHNTVDLSPFVVRSRVAKRKESLLEQLNASSSSAAGSLKAGQKSLFRKLGGGGGGGSVHSAGTGSATGTCSSHASDSDTGSDEDISEEFDHIPELIGHHYSDQVGYHHLDDASEVLESMRLADSVATATGGKISTPLGSFSHLTPRPVPSAALLDNLDRVYNLKKYATVSPGDMKIIQDYVDSGLGKKFKLPPGPDFGSEVVRPALKRAQVAGSLSTTTRSSGTGTSRPTTADDHGGLAVGGGGGGTNGLDLWKSLPIPLISITGNQVDYSSYSVPFPKVPEKSMAIYRNYVEGQRAGQIK